MTGAALLLVATSLAATLAAPPTPAPAHPIDAADFQQVGLARGVDETGEPISLAVLPDRSVLHTATETYNEWDFATGTSEAKYNCGGRHDVYQTVHLLTSYPITRFTGVRK